MKKILSVFLAGAVAASSLLGCGGKDTAGGAAETKAMETSGKEQSQELKTIDTLQVAFVPSREPDEIVTATEPLKDLLKQELIPLGYDVKDVVITVGTNYEAVGEGLTAGTIDVGFIPGGTYVLYSDGAEVILTATRDGLSVDSDDPKVWNDNKPTEASDEQVTFYRSLMIAGPSDAGKAVAAKVNSGDALSWNDLDGLNWGIMSPTSSAGYIYPALWMQKNFGKNITDLSHAVQSDSYGTAFARLAQGQIDVICVYADARRDNAEKWLNEYGMTNSIWDDTNVIGVTPGIYNDTISVSRASSIIDDDFKAALRQAFINIGSTDAGKEVIRIYNHKGYEAAQDSDYDSERDAQKIIQALRSR